MEDIEFVKSLMLLIREVKINYFKCFLKCAEFHSVALRWAVWKEWVQHVWASSRLFITADDYTAINHKITKKKILETLFLLQNKFTTEIPIPFLVRWLSYPSLALPLQLINSFFCFIK